MANLQSASSSEGTRPPAFKNSSLKVPDIFDGTQPFKVISFIHSCQLIFHNYQENFSEDLKKVIYATSFLIERAENWIEPYLSNVTNKDSSYFLDNWALFWDPNEVRKAEAELYGLIMKGGFHVSLYIAFLRTLLSRIENLVERALIHYFRNGLAFRTLNQLASHPYNIYSLQDLI
ncbi:hypothetical protein O181_056561 [Austropuccinia psidii MF-1]|uniref:DUF4939 domain-containing protein n=1 Tax=Austropuccinia psidii MF-1 TaxID=1389203 RepID=A0A9Q3EDH2_9BASI|nr:hypothetical protein [Austropuccinia psidii MF-1]